MPRRSPRGYGRALSALARELDLDCPRPPELLAATCLVMRFGDAPEQSRGELEKMDAVHTVARAATHLRGWHVDMVENQDDVVKVLEGLVGYGSPADGLLRRLIWHAPGRGASLMLRYANLFAAR